MLAHFLMSAIAAAPVLAQIVTGSIGGSVNDTSGLAVAGAEVRLVHSGTGRERQTNSDERGVFLLTGLDGGEYTLTITHPGFKQTTRQGLRLATGERLPVGAITLEVGAVSESVTVTARGGAMVQTQSAERAEVITSAQVQGLALRGRNVKDLMGLLPGVVVTSESEDLSLGTGINVNGNRATFNNISVDGVPSTDMGNGSQMKLTVSQDAVAEVKILLSNYQAEYGRMAGSNIQIVTKSGGNDYHGTFAYFKRHEQFNANNYFNNQNGQPRPRYRYNTFTYNVGGRVLRDKLFFFWNQEFWPTSGSATGRVTVPTALERAGNFSQSVDLNDRLIVVRDPVANTPFPGNVIPAARIDRNGQALLNFFPEPNFFDRAISRGQYNYVWQVDTDLPKHTESLKLDWNVNAKNTLTGGFNRYREDQTGAAGITTSSGNWPQLRKTYFTYGNGLTSRWTRVIRPQLLNEFSFGWLSQPAENTYTEEDLKRIQRDAVGFRTGQFTPEANPLGVLPSATFGGVTGAANIAMEGRFPLYNRYNIFNWSDNVTWNRGAHTIKAGVYVEMFFRHQKKSVNFNGSFDFGRNANNPLDTNYAYANAALGVFASYREISGPAWMRVRTGGEEFFIQDNWKLTRRLTLDYGLRMYNLHPIVERDDMLVGFVPSRYEASRAVQLIKPGLADGRRVGLHPVTGQVYAAAQIGAIAPGTGDPYNGMLIVKDDPSYPRGLIDNRGLLWGPRFGFAYDVFGNQKTAVRGGFGMFYNRHFTEVFSNPFVGQPPVLDEPVITYGQLNTLLQSAGLLYPNNVFSADRAGQLPNVMNYSLSVQQDVGYGTVLDIAYAGSLGRHLLWRRDTNAIPLGANFLPQNADPTVRNTPLPNAFLRPVTGYNNIQNIEAASSSNYHSLQVQAKRRFAAGLQFGLAWTWSKAMDFTDTDTDTITPLVDTRVWNYGLASFDRTHVFRLNYVWDIPNANLANPVLRHIRNGWQISGITSFISGAPLGIGLATTSALDITGTPSQGARVVVLSNPVLPKEERTFDRNFRTDVFRLPAVGTIGNAAKTVLRGPGNNNWDLAVFKNFPVAERVNLQFRSEFYNAFNHAQFSGLDTTTRFDPATGAQVNSGLGRFTAARNPRQIQFAVRASF